jgi:hypothetical protein
MRLPQGYTIDQTPDAVKLPPGYTLDAPSASAQTSAPAATMSATPTFADRLKATIQHPLNSLESASQPVSRPADATIPEMIGADIANVGAGAASVARHPLNTIGGIISSGFGMRPLVETAENKVLEGAGKPTANPNTQLIPHSPEQAAYAIGQTAAVAGAAKTIPMAVELAGSFHDDGIPGAATAKRVFNAIKTAASDDPDASALRALNVPAKSKQAQRVISSVDAARPYLQGSKTLAEAQDKLVAAKAEVWQPYQQAVQVLNDTPVRGPNGMTTVGQLELDRLELSAINRGLKTGDPQALKTAEQKGLNQSELLAQERAVQRALDPQLATTGIDPQAIRKTFGQLSTVQSKIGGRTTIAEKSAPMGVGRAVNVDIAHPATIFKEGALAAKDIIAGKPLISGKATDIDIANAFKVGGEKPNLGTFNNPRLTPMRPQLTATAGAPYAMPAPESAYTPTPAPPVSATTRAERLGLLLPERAGGAIPAYHSPMTPGEQTAALMQYLRSRRQAALPSRVESIKLPPPQ